MKWNAEQNIQLRPAEGTSSESSICVPTSAGCFIGEIMFDHKLYQQSEKYKKTHNLSQKKYRKKAKGLIRLLGRKGSKLYRSRHLNRIKARNAITHAITAGKLPHPDTLLCYCCPAQAKQYHHHKGYVPEHWFDIVPVCLKCHIKYRLKKVI